MEICAKLGTSGLEVVLKKTSIKKDSKSGVRVGNKKSFALHSSIKTGFAIMATREVDTIDPRRPKKKISVTSNVLGIKNIEENLFEIETETSFYEIKFV